MLRTTPVIPNKINRRKPFPYNKRAYRHRNKIERMFCRLKDARRIATHYDKCAENFLKVCPKSSSSQTKLSEHEANRGEAEKSECVSGEIFKILGQAATAIEPSEGAFDDPPPW